MTNSDAKDFIRYKENFIDFIKENRMVFNNQNHKFEILPLLKFERAILNLFHENKFSIVKKSRQMHLTTLAAAYCAWCMLFKTDYSIGVVSDKISNSSVIIEKVRIILQNFSNSIFHWEDDFVKNNKNEIRLKNGCSIKSFTPKNAGIGYQIRMYILDECAFYSLDNLFKIILPTINALKDTKLIAYSTPNGDNDFKVLWENSINKESNFENLSVNWKDNPNQNNDEWFDRTCKMLGNDEKTIKQEIWGEFVDKHVSKPKMISLRLNDSILNKVYKKIESENKTISEYLRELIKKDLE